MSLINREILIAEYDRVHVGPPGGARKLMEEAPEVKAPSRMIGRWVKVLGIYMSPGGAPAYVCGGCGGSEHLHGVEFQRRKVICDNCGRVNIYPWESAYEQGSSLWEDDE